MNGALAGQLPCKMCQEKRWTQRVLIGCSRSNSWILSAIGNFALCHHQYEFWWKAVEMDFLVWWRLKGCRLDQSSTCLCKASTAQRSKSGEETVATGGEKLKSLGDCRTDGDYSMRI